MSLENVKAFYERLASDEAFRTQIQGVESKETGREILKTSGYDFSQEEFEEYTEQLLEDTALPAAMRYTLKAESYDSRGVRGKLYRIIAGIAVMLLKMG